MSNKGDSERGLFCLANPCDIIDSVDHGPIVHIVSISVLTPDEASAILAGSTPKNLSFVDGFFVAQFSCFYCYKFHFYFILFFAKLANKSCFKIRRICHSGIKRKPIVVMVKIVFFSTISAINYYLAPRIIE